MKSLFYFALAICLLASCKKKIDQDELMGTWKMVEMTIDDNNNNVKDGNETVMQDSLPYYTYSFTSDGRVAIIYKNIGWGITSSSVWKLSPNRKTLSILESPTVPPYRHSNWIEYTVVRFTKGEMQLKLESNVLYRGVWRTWKKQ